ncbi:ABC transporter permease [Paenibacillus baekrokdamisoli]|uniref:ABC transporter permease n=1 Tax=Paenibacillus baekrokdamisoli TaxID=1712516 RepID=A0A3G9JIG3_9BACL|nr:ABC transporter permease subunit [Paenibacillus baekrokdamisoli]MBB3068147.1 putative spermidine/putrescine transport system permease protein [Paenibacillus baekrokdamisoli]BBH22809.1 ABC transporter permease [Paenibacillus baekrokdamisoli]
MKVKQRKRRNRRFRFYHAVLAIMLIYLFVPMLATLLYALAGTWQTTILPESWTLHWFADLLQDARFGESFLRSLFVCGFSLILGAAVITPAVMIISLEFPRWQKVLSFLALLPYAIPGVVAAVGLLRLYSSGPLPISGTVWLLSAAYVIAIMPYMYQGVRGSLQAFQAGALLEAATLLGANRWRAYRYVLLPNLLPGLTVSMLLSFAVLLGEFVLANLLVGGHYETVQLYLYRRQSESGHLSSAVAFTYFVLVLIVSGVMLQLSKRMFAAPAQVEGPAIMGGAASAMNAQEGRKLG